MNLDDLTYFADLDSQNMIAQIDDLPAQLELAWQSGKEMSLPDWEDIRQVVIAGMGGSAIGADLLSAYIRPQCRLPVFVHRDYGLPGWAKGKETLVIASSHSGNTEETLSAFETAVERGCRILVVATGGELARAASEAGVNLWRFEHQGQPRAAVGFSFGLLLAVFTRLKLIPDPDEEVRGAIQAMIDQQASINASVPTVKNPAKRLAGQLMGRWVVVLGSGVLAPVARRWKGQISEVAKSWAQFESLPEADHNTLAGVMNPEALLPKAFVLFLRGASDHPRNQLRSELTQKAMMLEGLNTDFVVGKGETSLANLWSSLHFGDYTAYYLAMAYGVDPTPIPAIESFKKEMQTAVSRKEPPTRP